MLNELKSDVREMLHEQVTYRELLMQMTKRDLMLRYKQTIMGFGWAIFMPLLNTLIFTGISMLFIVVFGKILANVLVADFKGKWIVRFFVLLPWTTPVSLSAVSWLWLKLAL